MVKTAIVIDDDADTVEIFSDLLEENHVKIIGKGYTGREAIDLFNEKQPDVVFVDIMMPDGTGFHAIREIRKIKENAKIIAVTADMKSITEEKLRKLKTPVVYKPFDMTKINQLIGDN